MVNKREKIHCIIFISDKRLSSFFISLILSLSFYCFLLFSLPFGRCTFFFLSTYLGGTFSPLLDISERNFFPRWGVGVHVHPVHPPYVRVWSFHIPTKKRLCSQGKDVEASTRKRKSFDPALVLASLLVLASRPISR